MSSAMGGSEAGLARGAGGIPACLRCRPGVFRQGGNGGRHIRQPRGRPCAEAQPRKVLLRSVAGALGQTPGRSSGRVACAPPRGEGPASPLLGDA